MQRIWITGLVLLGLFACHEDNEIEITVEPEPVCEASAEVCDGVDNDCDGTIDEGFDGLGDTCEVGVGACAATGVMACAPDGARVVCDAAAGTPGEEVCDGQDNDCDGDVDNVVGAGGTCQLGEGACTAEGVQQCDPDTGRLACTAAPGSAAEEVCDGVDNDCDGTVDNVAGLGDACEAGVGACVATGVQVCDLEARALTCDATPGAPVAEVCDGLDNDCNGTVDDAPGVGDTCQLGVGACVAEGAQTCDPGTGALICAAVEGSPAVEACDGIDNDCDGTIDNVAGLGDACTNGVGACEAAGTRVCDLGAGMLICDATPGTPGVEVCNGLDDDCNGAIDNVAGVGVACTVGVGACQEAGMQVCDVDAGALVCGATAGDPTAEVCNGLDDNCNDAIDEDVTQSCYTGPAGTQGVGACMAGTQTCTGGAFGGACVGEILPAEEVCDGIDNDCNGITDDVTGLGAACTNGVGACLAAGTRVCDVGAGMLVCDANPGTPGVEICNGLDDNCNSTIDDVVGLGDVCAVGLGECAAPGTRVCDLNTQQLVCDGTPGAPTQEVCNGDDDDCDGSIDDNVDGTCYTGPAGTLGVGVCRGGSRSCIGGAFTACIGDVVPGVEICNGFDDDCDGQIDENVTRSCYTGPAGTQDVGVCMSGIQTCNAGSFGACQGQVLPSAEVCDNLDNDCDGARDESVTQACYSGPAGTQGVGACMAGTRTCSAGSFGACQGEVTPTAEVCDNIDNDCDGARDESVTQACYTGPAGTAGVGPCRSGTQTCSAGSFGACQGQVLPSVETCDNVDNDCDGTRDENITRACYTGPAGTEGTGICRSGLQACVNGSFSGACNGQVTPQAEVCDGADNNCDGTSDNTSLAFTNVTHRFVPGCFSLTTGDLNNDGRLDIVCTPYINNPIDTRLRYWLNQGNNTFGSPLTAPAVPGSPFRTQSRVVAADVNRDGHLDLLTASEAMKVQVYLNNGNATFATPYEAFDFTTADGDHSTGGLVVADATGDGLLDIITMGGDALPASARLMISRGNGNGGFQPPTIYNALTGYSYEINYFDVDQDGDRDILVWADEEIWVYRRGAAAGSYSAPNVVVSGVPAYYRFASADATGDGRPDLLIPGHPDASFARASGAGFDDPIMASAPGSASAAYGQFDCDALPEGVVAAPNVGARIRIFLDPATFINPSEIVSPHNGDLIDIHVADVNGDGRDDLITAHQGGMDVLLRQP
jgi:hypothetical protein